MEEEHTGRSMTAVINIFPSHLVQGQIEKLLQ
jgi:hypothetical protein